MHHKTRFRNTDAPECIADAQALPCGFSRLGLIAGRMRKAYLAVFAATAGLWLACADAVAGDCCLRGGIGFDRPGSTIFTDVDCSLTSPDALYGCGTGGDGAPYRSRSHFGTAPTVEFGLGYPTGAARFEMLFEYRPGFTFESRANFLAPDRRQSVRRTFPPWPQCWPVLSTSEGRGGTPRSSVQASALCGQGSEPPP